MSVTDLESPAAGLAPTGSWLAASGGAQCGVVLVLAGTATVVSWEQRERATDQRQAAQTSADWFWSGLATTSVLPHTANSDPRTADDAGAPDELEPEAKTEPPAHAVGTGSGKDVMKAQSGCHRVA